MGSEEQTLPCQPLGGGWSATHLAERWGPKAQEPLAGIGRGVPGLWEEADLPPSPFIQSLQTDTSSYPHHLKQKKGTESHPNN